MEGNGANAKSGSIAQYAVTSAEFLVVKPKNISHVEATSIPLVSLTALQCFEKVAEASEGAFKGKTVFVPGGRMFSFPSS